MVRPRALNDAQAERAVEMYRDGLSRRQIAAAFGVSDMAVRGALARLRQPMRSRAEAGAVHRNPIKAYKRRASSVFDLARIVHMRPPMA